MTVPFRTFARAATMAGALLLAGLPLAQPSAAQSSRTLQVTTIFPESDFSSEVLRRWATQVTEKSEGRLKFRYHWAGSLVGNKTLDALRDGAVDVALQFTPYVSGDIVDLAAFDVPFSFPLDAKGLADFHREVKAPVTSIYARFGSHVVASAPIILPDPVTCRDRFLSSAEAWSGVIIRTDGRWQAEAIKNWGGSPVVIPPGELYSALERGTANCTLMVYNGVESMKLYQVAPRVTRVDHSIAFGTINVSDAAWAKLSDADKKIMQEAGDAIVDWAAQETNSRLEALLKRLADAGTQFCTPSDAEFQRLVAGADKVLDSVRGNVTADGAKILEIVGRYRPNVKARPAIGPDTACPG